MTRPDDRARRREQPEPEEGNRPVPKPVLALVGGLIIWGIAYIAMHTGWPLAGGDSRSPVAPRPAAAVDGAGIYAANCVSCHQGNGQGVPGAFPPLAGSRWVLGDPAVPAAIVSNGLSGPIEVQGAGYDGTMPAFGSQLSAEEIAAVVSHIRAQWGNQASSLGPAAVREIQDRHGERGPWSAEELEARFGPLTP